MQQEQYFKLKGEFQFHLFSDKWIDRNAQHKKAFAAISPLWGILNIEERCS